MSNGLCEPGGALYARHLSPEHPVPSPFERLRHRFLRRFGCLSCREGAYSFHQVEAQPDTVLVRFAGRQLPSRFVLREAVFGGVRGLSDVERRPRTRLARASP